MKRNLVNIFINYKEFVKKEAEFIHHALNLSACIVGPNCQNCRNIFFRANVNKMITYTLSYACW